MKLLMCLDCGDIFNLTYKDKSCGCGKTHGRYIDSLNAEYSGHAQAIGFNNKSFKIAYQLQKIEDKHQKKPTCCEGVTFEAFFIPEAATSLNKIELLTPSINSYGK
jgi:hypothetical protein